MISNAINSAFSSAWANVVYYASFQFLDPFWFWVMCLVGLYGAVVAICFFFGSQWPVLRTIGGGLLVAATFGLYSYHRGEKEARAHDEAKRPKPKPDAEDPYTYRRNW